VRRLGRDSPRRRVHPPSCQLFWGKGDTVPARRKSLQQHQLDGTTRPDRHPPTRSTAERPPATQPEHLAARPDAAREWDRVAPLLQRQGLITAADQVALAAYCAAFADFCALERLKAQAGFTPVIQTTTREGHVSTRAHPAIAAGIRVAGELRAWAVQLGLTPASRTAVSPVPGGEATSAFDAFRARRRTLDRPPSQR